MPWRLYSLLPTACLDPPWPEGPPGGLEGVVLKAHVGSIAPEGPLLQWEKCEGENKVNGIRHCHILTYDLLNSCIIANGSVAPYAAGARLASTCAPGFTSAPSVAVARPAGARTVASSFGNDESAVRAGFRMVSQHRREDRRVDICSCGWCLCRHGKDVGVPT